MNPRLVAVTQASGVLLASSFAGVLAKLALRDVAPFTFVWLQIAIGGALLTLYTFGLRKEQIPRGLGWPVWGYIAAIGIGNFTVVRVLFMLSLERLPATTHVYLVNFVGVVTMLLSIAVLRERPSFLQVVGAVVALAGIRVFFPEIPPPGELRGVVYAGVGVLALAATNNLARKLAIATDNRLSNDVVSTVALWIGGVPVVAFGLVSDVPPAVAGWTNRAIIALSGIVAVAIGLTVWNHILRTLRSYEASVLASSTLVYTALLALPILGEELALHQVAGMVLMIVGMFLVQLRPRLRA